MPSLQEIPLPPGELVAVEAPWGPGWQDLLERVWHSEAAILPVDPTLPGSARDRLLEAARPAALFRPGALDRLDRSEPVAPGTALVIATSGSTGEPKLVELGRPAIDAAVRGSVDALGATARDPWLCCLPLSHVGGLLVVLRAIVLGAAVHFLPAFDPDAVGRVDAAFVSLVPTMLTRLLDAGVDLGTYRTVVIGGSRLDPALRRRAEAAGVHVVETYGLTESCGGVVYGGEPFLGVGVRIGSGEEIQLSGPTLMSGYRGERDATAETFTEDGWLRTRDRGEIRPDGRLRVRGRLDDAIVSGGENVRPQAVERALANHPKVAAIRVVGVSDPKWGERVTALIVPVDPTDPPNLQDLRDHGRGRLAPSWLPRGIEIVHELPDRPLGTPRQRGGG